MDFPSPLPRRLVLKFPLPSGEARPRQDGRDVIHQHPVEVVEVLGGVVGQGHGVFLSSASRADARYSDFQPKNMTFLATLDTFSNAASRALEIAVKSWEA